MIYYNDSKKDDDIVIEKKSDDKLLYYSLFDVSFSSCSFSVLRSIFISSSFSMIKKKEYHHFDIISGGPCYMVQQGYEDPQSKITSVLRMGVPISLVKCGPPNQWNFRLLV